MKILSAVQIREADLYTIQNEPVSSIDLMERAARACLDSIIEICEKDNHFAICCGNGNNGGDGLALARMLTQTGKKVTVFDFQLSSPSTDFTINLSRLKESRTEYIQCEKISAEDFSGFDVIIDALFGTGLREPLRGKAVDVVRAMNGSGKKIIAIDLPSGLHADEFIGGEAVRANFTLTFQLPKLTFLFRESYPYTGEWFVLDIGLDQEFIHAQHSEYEFADAQFTKGLFKSRQRFSHKGDFGHSLIVAGSKGKIGAAILAAGACLRTGAGLVTVHLPSCGANVMHSMYPETMVDEDANSDFISEIPAGEKYTAIGIGPGIGTGEATVDALIQFLRKTSKPIVLDADALNILSANPGFLSEVPHNSILTPHPKEFDRLAGESVDSFHRLKKQVEFSKVHKVIVVLKGAYTSVSLPDGKVYFNSTGNPALSKGGSGDVLTGMVTAFLSQRYSPAHSAILATYLHGRAADKLVESRADFSVLASDLIDQIGKTE